MATSNIIETSLPDYVQTNHDLLVKNLVLGGKSIARMTKQVGVKKSAYLNYLAVEPTIADGSGCGWNEAGTITATQRTINTALMKVNMALCEKKLLGKYNEYLVKIGAGNEECPYEQVIVDGIVKGIVEKMEKAVWQWDDTQTGELFDGILTIAAADSSVIDVTIASGASAYAGLKQVYAAIPEYVHEKGAKIFVAPAIFRAFMQEMVNANLYHYNPGDGELEEFFLPGTGCKVVKTLGLANSLKVVATYDENLVYGTDLMGNEEKVDIFYERSAQEFRFIAEWNSGVQIAFPEHLVLGVFAATPVSPNAQMEQLASIAASSATIATKATTLAGAVNASGQIETHNNA